MIPRNVQRWALTAAAAALLLLMLAPGWWRALALVPVMAVNVGAARALWAARRAAPVLEGTPVPPVGSMQLSAEQAWRARYQIPALPVGGWVSGAMAPTGNGGWWFGDEPPYPPAFERLATLADLEQTARLAAQDADARAYLETYTARCAAILAGAP
jgi:hypothetical protein